MKYPLKRHHRLAREMWCSVVGHTIKSSWRRRDDYNVVSEMADEDLPYSQKQTGNHYFEFSGGWEDKCRRCRRKWRREGAPIFIRHQLGRGFRAACAMLFDKTQPWEKHLPLRYKLLLRFGNSISQFTIYQDWWWPTLQYFGPDIQYYIFAKVNDYEHSNEVSSKCVS